MVKVIRISGIFSLLLGSTAVILCLVPVKTFLTILSAIFLGFMGFVFTCVYIVLNNKYKVNTKKINPGIIGLVLNSIPLLYVITMMVYTKMTH